MAGGKIDILVHPDVKDFPGKLESGLRGSLGTAAKIGGAIGAALGGASAIKGIATIGIEFDKQMNTMSAVSQASAGQLEAVEAKARELGRSTDLTATSASDAAAAMVELSKGGFTVQESMDAAKGTLQLAAAAGIEAADAATIQSQALQAFGADASFASTAADLLAGAANASSAEIEGIAQGLQQSGTVANQFGLSMEDNATALAMFANAGIQGSDAGTLLKSALLALTDQGKPAQEAIEELGLTVYDAQGKFVGMESLFGQLSDAQARMTDEQYQAATATLFGSDAMRLAGIAAEQGAEGWRTTYAAVTRSGQAAEVAAAQAQGLPGILEAVQNQAEDAGLAIYDAFSGLALQGGGRLIEVMQQAGPLIASAAQGIATGVTASLPTIERIVSVVAEGVSQIGDSLGVLGGAGISAITGLAGALAPAASGALNLSESLGSMTGTLLTAGAALAVGKWQGWGDAVESSLGKVKTGRENLSQMMSLQQALALQQGVTIGRIEAFGAALESQYPAVHRMGEAYRSTGAEMRTHGVNAARWGSELGGLTGVMRTTQGVTMQLGGTFGGVLAAGASGARSAIGGVIGALGGPWNLAIAGAMMAVQGFTAEIAKSRKSVDLMQELGNASEKMGEQLFGAMSHGDLKGEISAVTASMETLLSSYEQLAQTGPGVFSGFTAAWGDLVGMIEDRDITSSKGSDAYYAQMETAENAKLVSEALREAGITAEEAGAAVGGSAAQYDALISRLDLSTEGGRAAAAAFGEQREEFLAMQAITDSLTPGSVALADALKVIGDEAASSEERVAALNTVLNEMLGIDPTADEALAGLHEQIDEVTESATEALDQTQGFGESLFGGDGIGGLDYAQANALTLRDTLMGMRDSLVKVAETGGDVQGAFDLQQGALSDLAAQYGLTTEQMQALTEAAGLVPETIESAVTVSTEEALAGLQEVWAQLDKIQVGGEPIRVPVENIDESISALEDLGFTVEELHRNADGSGAISVTADTEQAKADLDAIVAAANEIQSEKGITISSNASEQVEQLRGLGITIDETPDGDYRIGSNTPEQIQLMLDLGLLVRDEKTGKVTIASNLDEVLRKGRELDGRNGRETRERHTVETVNRQWTEYLGSGRASSSGGTSVGQHYAAGGRHLPAYAAGVRHGGYRLPTTGPGTGVVDGFTAYNMQGAAAARLDAGEWVINGISSAKYDPLLRAINSNSPRAEAALNAFANLPAFADGGMVSADELLAFARGQTVNGQTASRGLEGAPYVFGGSNWGDCSSTQGQLALFAAGRPATNGRYMSTMDEDQQLAALGFLPGLGGPGDYSIGWMNGGPGGGHTSGTIGDINVEMGGNRGNGQIGGGAAPASHGQFTHKRHLPLADSDGSTEYDENGVEITSTSVSGFSYKGKGASEKKANWGEAARFYEQAREYLGVYDTGGVLRPGGMAVNLSGASELVINDRQLGSFARLTDELGALVQILRRGDTAGAQAQLGVINKTTLEGMTEAVSAAEDQVVSFGRTLGGEWLGKAKIVQDAERGLAETRKGLAEENKEISAQEDAVAEARENLAKVSAESGELSTSMTRKVADAEEALSKARAGKDGKVDAQKVADAEKKLARAREDASAELAKSEEKNAKEVQSALEDVEKAESDLADARELQESQAKRLEAAERAVAAARYQAVADLAEQVGDAMSEAFGSISDLFGVLAQQAKIMEETRQRLAKEQIEQRTTDLSLQRSRLDALIAEQDIARVRAMGAVSIADAEAALAKARELAALKGATGVDAMSRALDRARVTGIFAIEDIAGSVIDNSAEVRAAQHAVEQAKAQAALDELSAIHAQRLAVLDLAQASLMQQQAIAMVQISTQQLAAQAKELGGLTAQGAGRAASGWGGIAQAGGGLGKLLMGLAGGAAGFATGGPIGALIGGGAGVIGGLFDLLGGIRTAVVNKDEIKQSFEGMSTLDKIITGGSLVLGTGVSVIGAVGSQQFGPELAGTTAGLGGQIISGGAKYAGDSIKTDLDRINSLAEESRAKLELQVMLEQARINEAKAKQEMEYLRQSTALKADVEIAELLGRIAKADTTQQADALARAAIVAAERRDQMLDIMSRQLNLQQSQANAPRQQIVVQIPDTHPYKVEMESLVDTLGRVQDAVEIRREEVSGREFLAAQVG